MSLIAGLSALALSVKMKMAIAGVFAKTIGGVYLYKTVKRANASAKKKTTGDEPKGGQTP
jgi:hypothetical protein